MMRHVTARGVVVRLRALGGLLVIVLAALPRGAAKATPPPELRKLHALLVVDTLSGLGEGVKIDGERIDHLLSERLPRDRAEIVVRTGKDVNAEAILSYYRGLKVDREDVLFFYYAGHGATDPKKGQFLALQDLATPPLIRSELRKAMQQHHPGLIVIMTDCCSTSFTLGKTRRIVPDKGTAAEVDPLLRCLLFQSRGVIDITAASGDASFGDDHEGGIFTRTFGKMVDEGISRADTDGDGFVSWPEFFAKLQTRTQGVFVTWAQHQRARGEDVDQASQKPHAFSLGGSVDAAGPVRLRNDRSEPMEYEYRWADADAWQKARIAPHAVAEHAPPASAGGKSASLEVRFEGGKTATLKTGKTYRFHENKTSSEKAGGQP
jgi:Caspase domain